MYWLQTIREIVQKHDVTFNEEDTRNFTYNPLSKKKLVAFYSPHFIGLTRDEVPVDESQSWTLKEPICYKNLLEFLKMNRHLLKYSAKRGVDFNGDIVDENPHEMPPMELETYLREIREGDDAEIWEFDDKFNGNELLYAIIINR